MVTNKLRQGVHFTLLTLFWDSDRLEFWFPFSDVSTGSAGTFRDGELSRDERPDEMSDWKRFLFLPRGFDSRGSAVRSPFETFKSVIVSATNDDSTRKTPSPSSILLTTNGDSTRETQSTSTTLSSFGASASVDPLTSARGTILEICPRDGFRRFRVSSGDEVGVDVRDVSTNDIWLVVLTDDVSLDDTSTFDVLFVSECKQNRFFFLTSLGVPSSDSFGSFNVTSSSSTTIKLSFEFWVASLTVSIASLMVSVLSASTKLASLASPLYVISGTIILRSEFSSVLSLFNVPLHWRWLFEVMEGMIGSRSGVVFLPLEMSALESRLHSTESFVERTDFRRSDELEMKTYFVILYW